MKTATEFGQQLLDAAAPDGGSDAFLDGISAGTLPRSAVRGFAVAVFGLAGVFPRRLAAVLSICDDDRVRRVLMGNLLEEEGVVGFEPGAGLRVDPRRSHYVLARRFALAAGATTADLVAAAAGIREARWFGEAIRRGDWLGAFAYFAIGHEANVPSACGRMLQPLQSHYGLSAEDVEFVSEHFVADERHGIESADLIASIATTPDLRSDALEGARRGGRGWHAMLRRCVPPLSVPA